MILAVAAVLISGAVSGLVGFGFALVCVPLLLLVYDPVTVISVNAALSIFTTTTIAFEARRDVEVKSIALLLPFALVGLILGVEILRAANPEYIRGAVGVVVVISALLLFRGARLPGSGSRWGDGVAGGASGLLATTVGISGPPVILLLASRGLPKRAFRANIALYFVFTSSASLVALYLRGLVEPGHLFLAAISDPRRLRRQNRRGRTAEQVLREGVPQPDAVPDLGHRNRSLGLRDPGSDLKRFSADMYQRSGFPLAHS